MADIDYAKTCTALRRVVLVDNADRPMNDFAKSPGMDKVFERYALDSRKTYLLWLSRDRQTVYVEDPRSGQVEDFPITFVRQYQRLTQQHLDWIKSPPPAGGQVRSLEPEKAKAAAS